MFAKIRAFLNPVRNNASSYSAPIHSAQSGDAPRSNSQPTARASFIRRKSAMFRGKTIPGVIDASPANRPATSGNVPAGVNPGPSGSESGNNKIDYSLIELPKAPGLDTIDEGDESQASSASSLSSEFSEFSNTSGSVRSSESSTSSSSPLYVFENDLSDADSENADTRAFLKKLKSIPASVSMHVSDEPPAKLPIGEPGAIEPSFTPRAVDASSLEQRADVIYKQLEDLVKNINQKSTTAMNAPPLQRRSYALIAELANRLLEVNAIRRLPKSSSPIELAVRDLRLTMLQASVGLAAEHHRRMNDEKYAPRRQKSSFFRSEHRRDILDMTHLLNEHKALSEYKLNTEHSEDVENYSRNWQEKNAVELAVLHSLQPVMSKEVELKKVIISERIDLMKEINNQLSLFSKFKHQIEVIRRQPVLEKLLDPANEFKAFFNQELLDHLDQMNQVHEKIVAKEEEYKTLALAEPLLSLSPDQSVFEMEKENKNSKEKIAKLQDDCGRLITEANKIYEENIDKFKTKKPEPAIHG